MGYGFIRADNLRLTGARVGHAEAAVWVRDDSEVCSIAAAFEIGDERVGAAVRGIGIFCRMQHVVLQSGALMHRLPRLGTAGLVRAVVHDGNARVNGIDKGARVREVETVMVHEIKIDVSDEVVGADQRNLFGLREIAEDRESGILPKRTRIPAERGFSVVSRSHWLGGNRIRRRLYARNGL